jgi:hypothetical protein
VDNLAELTHFLSVRITLARMICSSMDMSDPFP